MNETSGAEETADHVTLLRSFFLKIFGKMLRTDWWLPLWSSFVASHNILVVDQHVMENIPCSSNFSQVSQIIDGSRYRACGSYMTSYDSITGFSLVLLVPIRLNLYSNTTKKILTDYFVIGSIYKKNLNLGTVGFALKKRKVFLTEPQELAKTDRNCTFFECFKLLF